MKTISGLVTVAFLSLAVLSGCVSNDGVSKEKGTSIPSPSESVAPTNSTAPRPAVSPPSPANNTTTPPVTTPPPPAAGSKPQVMVLTGKVTASATTRTALPFDVAPGAKEIQAYMQWADTETEFASPVLSDFSLFLKPLGGSTDVGSAVTSDFEYIRLNDTTKLAAGKWVAEYLPLQITGETAYQLNITIFYTAPKVVTFTGKTDAASSAPPAGAVNTVTGPVVSSKVAIPATATVVTVRLAWIDNPTQGTPGAQPLCGKAVRYAMSDYDLHVLKGTKVWADSENAQACEWTQLVLGQKGVPLADGTDWEFKVIPYAVVASTWFLTVEYV